MSYLNSGYIYDNIHGYIPLNKTIRKIIDTPVFQRLRYIHQTGALFLVFQTANHSRFEHSIGVYHLANKFIMRLQDKQPELKITDKIVGIVSIAGLCHDLGHLFYSHLFDDLFLKKLPNYKSLGTMVEHEERSKLLLSYLVEKYNINLSKSELKVIGDLINPKKSDYNSWDEEFKIGKWIFQIVSNPVNDIDVDKFDYIDRDNRCSGLKLNFEYGRIIEQARVINDNIHYPIQVKDDIYHMFFIRYRLHRQIYNHKTVKKIEILLTEALFELEKTEKISEYINYPEKMIKLTDMYLHFSNNEKIKKIIYNIEIRNLPLLLYEKISISEDLKNKEFLEKLPFSRDKIKVIEFNVGYTSGKNKNPLTNIYFFETKTFKVIKLDSSKNFSLLINKKHKEHFLRIYCLDKDKFNIYNKIIQKFPTN